MAVSIKEGHTAVRELLRMSAGDLRVAIHARSSCLAGQWEVGLGRDRRGQRSEIDPWGRGRQRRKAKELHLGQIERSTDPWQPNADEPACALTGMDLSQEDGRCLRNHTSFGWIRVILPDRDGDRCARH